jgi:hypothetical protein
MEYLRNTDFSFKSIYLHVSPAAGFKIIVWSVNR